MSDLADLYQEVIVDHGRRPRNFGRPVQADRSAEGYNPLCGDRLTLYLRLAGDVIAEARFEGAGCAISTASASLMTEALQGRTVAEAEALFADFHAFVTAGGAAGAGLGKLAALGGVRQYPMRIKCATLAWHTLQAALHDDPGVVSTDGQP